MVTTKTLVDADFGGTPLPELATAYAELSIRKPGRISLKGPQTSDGRAANA